MSILTFIRNKLYNLENDSIELIEAKNYRPKTNFYIIQILYNSDINLKNKIDTISSNELAKEVEKIYEKFIIK